MRHQKRINSLSRTNTHRKAMLSNMATSLIVHKRISTTLAKARALRKYVEPLITRSKTDTMHSRRMVMRYLQNKEAVNELFREVSVKVADREGGYTRILKTGFRPGDNAEMCIIELVDYNEAMLEAKDEKKTAGKKRTRRSRRGGGSGKAADAQTQVSANKPQSSDKPAPESPNEKDSPTDETESKSQEVSSDTAANEKQQEPEKTPENVTEEKAETKNETGSAEAESETKEKENPKKADETKKDAEK